MGEGPSGRPRGARLDPLEAKCSVRAFVLEQQSPLMNLAQRILGDPIEAEDVTIEVMSRLIRRLDELNSRSRFIAYAKASVRNAAVDRLRQRSFRDARRALRDTDSLRRARPDDPEPAELLSSSVASADENLERAETRETVRAAVDSLGEPKHTIVVMYYEQDRTHAEIAEALGLSLSTVKRHHGAARLLLARRLCAFQRDSHVA